MLVYHSSELYATMLSVGALLRGPCQPARARAFPPFLIFALYSFSVSCFLSYCHLIDDFFLQQKIILAVCLNIIDG